MGAGGALGSLDGGVDAAIIGTGDAAGIGAGGNGGGTTGGIGGNPAGGGQGGSARGKQVPDGLGLAEWKLFLEAGEYKKQGWVAETALPRAKRSISPHGRVRVHFNEKMKQAHSEFPASYPAGSATVKEFFDSDDVLQGWTALLKTRDGSDEYSAWALVCIGPDNPCVQPMSVGNRSEFADTLEPRPECFGCHHAGAYASTTKLIYTRAP